MTWRGSRCIIGLQWGDEGKGKIVDMMAANATIVARFQGGNNAGHTVITQGRKVVLHLVPSGILQPHTHCLIGAGVVLNCTALAQEINTLNNSGLRLAERLSVDLNCPLIMPHHIALDQAREERGAGLGTTKRGIGPAHEDRIARRAVRLGEVLADQHREGIATSIAVANRELQALQARSLDPNEVIEQVSESAARIVPYAGDVAAILIAANKRDEAILLEGAQGALLDIDQGTYPHVTSSGCLASAAPAGLGVDLQPEVIGIAKAYVTRVGRGIMPTEADGQQADHLRVIGKERGATTQRLRRVGWLDLPALRHALLVNGCRRMILTKIDVMAELEEVRLCIAYRHKGNLIERLQPAGNFLAQCEPVYETLAGWPKIPPTATALPAAATSYLNRIEELTGAKIDLVSIGSDREANIIPQNPEMVLAR